MRQTVIDLGEKLRNAKINEELNCFEYCDYDGHATIIYNGLYISTCKFSDCCKLRIGYPLKDGPNNCISSKFILTPDEYNYIRSVFSFIQKKIDKIIADKIGFDLNEPIN